MFRQMDELLARLPSDEKIILMGHNLHLSKDYRTVRFGQLQMWPSVGSHVHSRLPGEVYSIWMLYDHGRHGNVSAQAFQYVPSHPRRIESLMSRAGGAYLLPLGSDDPRAAFLDEARGFVINGGQGSGLLRKSADALFFVSEVHEVGKRK